MPGFVPTISPLHNFAAAPRRSSLRERSRVKDDRLLAAHTYILSLEKTIKRGSPLQSYLKDLRASPLFLQNIYLGEHVSREGRIGDVEYASILDESKKSPNQDSLGIIERGKLFVITDGYQEEGHWCSLVMQKAVADRPDDEADVWVKRATQTMRDLAIGPFSGTCFVSLRLTPKGGAVAWLGDSKCFHVRGKDILFETEEHTIASDAIREGRTSASALWNTHDHHVVSKSVHPLGDDGPVEAELNLERGDWIILCSDGVSDNLKSLKKGVENYDRVVDILQRSSNKLSSTGPKDARDQILSEVHKHISLGLKGDPELADSKKDNISLIVLRT